MAGAADAPKRAPPDFNLHDPPPRRSARVEFGSSSRAIVVDFGSSALRAGFSAAAAPALNHPPYVSRTREVENGIVRSLTGYDALSASSRSSARAAYEAGIPNNPALIERLLDNALVGLGLGDEERITHQFIVTEPPCQPNTARGIFMELLFEAYETPSICIGIDALFSHLFNRHSRSSYGLQYGRESSVVVSCGYNATHILPVQAGQYFAPATKRINVGGADMTTQLMSRLRLLNPDHASILSFPRVEALREKLCFVAQDYDSDLNRMQKEVDFFNEIAKSVKVPFAEGIEKVPLSAAEQARLRQAKIDNGRRLSEMMKEKRRAKLASKAKNGEIEEPEDVKYTQEEVDTFYSALAGLYELRRIDEMRKLDEDKFFMALIVGNFEDTKGLAMAIDKRESDVELERQKLGLGKADAAETAWWRRLREDELMSVSDTDLSAAEIHKKRRLKSLRGAAEARTRMKKEKELEQKARAQREEDLRRIREEDPEGYLNRLRAERLEVAEKIKRRAAAKESGSDRRSHAGRERMRLLAKHAGNKGEGDEGPAGGGGKSGRRSRAKGGKRKDDDTFGMDDADWDVYRSMKLRNDGGDSDDNSGIDREKLHQLREEISGIAPNDIDPTISRPEGSALLYEENPYADEFSVSVDRLRTTEMLFHPSLIGVEQCGIVEALQTCVNLFPSDEERRSIVNEVFITGAVGSTRGLEERIRRELVKIFPTAWASDIEAGVRTAKDPELDAWRGAALFAEQGGEAYEAGCISKAEYDEKGAGYLQEHVCSNMYVPTPPLNMSESDRKRMTKSGKRGRPPSASKSQDS